MLWCPAPCPCRAPGIICDNRLCCKPGSREGGGEREHKQMGGQEKSETQRALSMRGRPPTGKVRVLLARRGQCPGTTRILRCRATGTRTASLRIQSPGERRGDLQCRITRRVTAAEQHMARERCSREGWGRRGGSRRQAEARWRRRRCEEQPTARRNLCPGPKGWEEGTKEDRRHRRDLW